MGALQPHPHPAPLQAPEALPAILHLVHSRLCFKPSSQPSPPRLTRPLLCFFIFSPYNTSLSVCLKKKKKLVKVCKYIQSRKNSKRTHFSIPTFQQLSPLILNIIDFFPDILNLISVMSNIYLGLLKNGYRRPSYQESPGVHSIGNVVNTL